MVEAAERKQTSRWTVRIQYEHVLLIEVLNIVAHLNLLMIIVPLALAQQPAHLADPVGARPTGTACKRVAIQLFAHLRLAFLEDSSLHNNAARATAVRLSTAALRVQFKWSTVIASLDGRWRRPFL